MRSVVPVFLCILLALSLFCSRSEPVMSGKGLIFVSIPPQKYFVEKICGDDFSVKTLIPAGASPHSYEPKPLQMAQLADAEIYFSIGIEMERVWLPRIAKINPRLKIVATDSGIIKLTSDDTAGETGMHEGHRHEGADPHIWLSPDLVRQQARCIARALAAIDTARGSYYRERQAAFEAEIDSLQKKITAELAACGADRRFLVFHPSWGYFAREFSLEQIAIEVEGKEPGIRELGEIVARAKREGISTVLVQPQFSRKTAAIVAREMGGNTAVADPLAEDWADNLLRVTGVLCRK